MAIQADRTMTVAVGIFANRPTPSARPPPWGFRVTWWLTGQLGSALPGFTLRSAATARKAHEKRSLCHETIKGTAAADGSLDVIADTAKRRMSHDGAVRRYATSTSGGAYCASTAAAANPRIRCDREAGSVPPRGSSLPSPACNRGWR